MEQAIDHQQNGALGEGERGRSHISKHSAWAWTGLVAISIKQIYTVSEESQVGLFSRL